MTPEEAWLPVSVLASDARFELGHFDALAKALETALDADAWRCFRRPDTQELQQYEADDFARFLATPPTAGCGVELDGLLAVLRARHRDDLERRVRHLTSAEVGKVGVANFGGEREHDASYVVGRLKRDRPDLATQVADGKLSANAAAIEAGIRHRYVRVRVDDIDRAVSALLDHYSRDELFAALFQMQEPVA